MIQLLPAGGCGCACADASGISSAELHFQVEPRFLRAQDHTFPPASLTNSLSMLQGDRFWDELRGAQGRFAVSAFQVSALRRIPCRTPWSLLRCCLAPDAAICMQLLCRCADGFLPCEPRAAVPPRHRLQRQTTTPLAVAPAVCLAVIALCWLVAPSQASRRRSIRSWRSAPGRCAQLSRSRACSARRALLRVLALRWLTHATAAGLFVCCVSAQGGTPKVARKTIEDLLRKLADIHVSNRKKKPHPI